MRAKGGAGMDDAAPMKGRVLVIAGSDSGGGAGLQADAKTATALGAFAMTVVTAVTAQNSRGVVGVHPIPSDFVALQLEAVATDFGADAWKTGMLHDAEIVATVARLYDAHGHGVPLVVDPVMQAKGGAALLDPTARGAMDALLARAALLTPNAPEAQALTGIAIADEDALHAAAEALARRGPRAVLVKGGHLRGDEVVDVLCTREGERRAFRSPRIETRSDHGTGCTLASAIAAGLAQGLPLIAAIERARRYVALALLTAPGFGHGHGPLNHAHTIRPS